MHIHCSGCSANAQSLGINPSEDFQFQLCNRGFEVKPPGACLEDVKNQTAPELCQTRDVGAVDLHSSDGHKVLAEFLCFLTKYVCS